MLLIILTIVFTIIITFVNITKNFKKSERFYKYSKDDEDFKSMVDYQSFIGKKLGK